MGNVYEEQLVISVELIRNSYWNILEISTGDIPVCRN